MAVSYKKLFKRLIDMEIKKLEFAKNTNISVATLAKLSGNKYVALEIIERICQTLNCTPNDILEFFPDPNTALKSIK